jgi:UDP-glucose 4-epimerase
MIEEMLKDIVIANPEFSVTLLRYFNPIGCHSSGLIGEDPNGIPTCLFPYILRTAIGQYDKINIFGSDYETRDGTCIRDYIHVVDLADGHIAALNLPKGIHIYNLGTGKGSTVLEVIKTFEEVNKIKLNYEFTERRSGDLAESYANTNKALKELGWKANLTLEDMCKDGLNFIKSF